MRLVKGTKGPQSVYVTHDADLFGSPLPAMHVTRRTHDIKRLAPIAVLYDRKNFRSKAAVVEQQPDTQSRLQPARCFCTSRRTSSLSAKLLGRSAAYGSSIGIPLDTFRHNAAVRCSLKIPPHLIGF